MGATRSNGLTSLYNTMKRSTLPDVLLKHCEGERPYTPLHFLIGLSTHFPGIQAWRILSDRMRNKSYKPSKEENKTGNRQTRSERR